MNTSEKNELSLECMILMALLDQKMKPEEIELLRNFSKEHELEEHYKQVDREYNKFSQEKIKKELLSRSDQFESEEDRFHLLCHLSEMVTCDRDISPDEQEVLSQIEKNFNSNFGFRAPSSLDFDAEQREVIDAERFEKFIVDAKAGSGKTEVKGTENWRTLPLYLGESGWFTESRFHCLQCLWSESIPWRWPLPIDGSHPLACSNQR